MRDKEEERIQELERTTTTEAVADFSRSNIKQDGQIPKPVKRTPANLPHPDLELAMAEAVKLWPDLEREVLGRKISEQLTRRGTDNVMNALKRCHVSNLSKPEDPRRLEFLFHLLKEVDTYGAVHPPSSPIKPQSKPTEYYKIPPERRRPPGIPANAGKEKA